MDLAEPPLQAEIIISSSMTESLILLPLAIVGAHRTATNLSLPLWTMKTSLFRIDVSASCELVEGVERHSTYVSSPMSLHS
jgi:hypothetical protein